MEIKFDSTYSMIYLAKEIQSKIYWGSHFYNKADDKDYHYKLLWDLVEDAVDNGYVRMTISDDDTVEFFKE